jgi:hypothetical protein
MLVRLARRLKAIQRLSKNRLDVGRPIQIIESGQNPVYQGQDFSQMGFGR